GQPGPYLARQLEAYADGSRANAVMAPIAKGMSDEQKRAVAAYYASLSAPAGSDGGNAAPGDKGAAPGGGHGAAPAANGNATATGKGGAASAGENAAPAGSDEAA